MTLAAHRLTDFYELLGVPPEAGSAEIEAAFARQYQVWPARLRSPQRPDRAYAQWVLRVLGDAEGILRRPGRRREFDAAREQQLAGGPAVAPAAAASWHDRAHHYLADGNPAAAHRLAREAIWYVPDSAVAWLVRGLASALRERFADAEHELVEAAGLAPAEPLPRYLLAEVYAAQGRWLPALARYDQALALDPQSAPALAGKAEALVALDRADQAVGLLEPVVARFPGDDMYSAPLAWACHDAAAGRLTRAPGSAGGVWTSAAQIAGLRRAADRIDRLRCDDPEAARLARSLRDFADRGMRSRWDTSAPGLYLWLGGLGFLWACGVGVEATGQLGAGLAFGGLVASVLAGGPFVLRRRKPAWKLAAESTGGGNLSRRIIAVARRATTAVFRVLDR
jgi:tetratricopeptide (TPR) repeat protein